MRKDLYLIIFDFSKNYINYNFLIYYKIKYENENKIHNLFYYYILFNFNN